MSRLARSIGLIAAAAGGLACPLLGYGTQPTGGYSSGGGSGSSAADRERAEYAAQAAVREQQEQDRATAAEIERRRYSAETDKTPESILAFCDALFAAVGSGAVERGEVNGPNNIKAARELLDAAMDSGPTPALQLASARFAYLAGDTEVALTHYEALMTAAPSVELFDEMRLLPKTPEVDAAVVRACSPVRGLIQDDQLFVLVDTCLARADGNRKQLKWKGAKRDLRFYDDELARIAEEERLAAEAAAQAAAEAQAEAAKSEQFVIAAVFAAGDCEFGDCAGNGWTTRTADGDTVRSRCSFGKCLEDGWETTFPDGSSARTSCNFSKCLEDGWETRFPDGSSARTSCNFGKCETDGWETRLPDGSTARTSCNFSKCFTDGWETRLPTGGSVRCDCKFGDCLGNGTECR